MKNFKLAALALLGLFASANAMAEVVTEDFESVTLENADTWGRATQLSNGWFVQGGYISTSKDSYDYGFWTTAYNGSSKSLTAQYGGTNNAYVIIPVLMTGDVTFYYRKTSTSSSTAGKVYAYKVTENEGTYTIGSRIFMDESATTSWQQCTSIKLTEPTMIAFKMVRAAIDDVVYNTASLEPHEHSYASEWSSDVEGHWHACTSETGICDAKKADYAAHDGAICSVCGYEVAGVKAFPWTENFNDLTSGIPANWDNSEGTTTTASYKWNFYSSGHEGKGLRFDSYNNKSGITNVLATPYLFIPETGEYELDFWYKNPKGGDFSVKVAEYGSAEKTVLAEGLTDKDAWTELKVSLAAYAGKIVKLYFCGTSNWGSGDAYIYLDDVTVKETVLHIHDYADAWSHDYNSHWHACQSGVGECDAQQLDLAAHTLNAEGVCTVCGYDQPYMEDFEAGIPASWNKGSWQLKDGTTSANGTKMAYSYYYTTPLVTPLLKAKAGEEIQFDLLQVWADESFAVEYSINDAEEWNKVLTIVAEGTDQLDKYTTYSWTAPADGYYRLRFAGKYYYLDNVCGFKLAQHELALVAKDKENTYYATFSNQKDVKFVDGATVYAVSVEADELVLTEVADKYVPANTGVLVACAQNSVTYYDVEAQASGIPGGNMLVAASVAMSGDYRFYKLAYDDYEAKTGLGFYWGAADGGAFAAKTGGAYLAMPKDAGSIKGFRFDGGDVTTGIEAAATEKTADVIYNLQGQRVALPQSGLYVKNGKVVLR